MMKRCLLIVGMGILLFCKIEIGAAETSIEKILKENIKKSNLKAQPNYRIIYPTPGKTAFEPVDLDSQRRLTPQEEMELVAATQWATSPVVSITFPTPTAIADTYYDALHFRRQAIMYMGKDLSHERCIDPLVKILNNPQMDERTRWVTIDSLSLIESPRIIDEFLEFLDHVTDERDPLKFNVYLRLRQLTGRHFGDKDHAWMATASSDKRKDALRKWRSWWKDVRKNFVVDRMKIHDATMIWGTPTE